MRANSLRPNEEPECGGVKRLDEEGVGAGPPGEEPIGLSIEHQDQSGTDILGESVAQGANDRHPTHAPHLEVSQHHIGLDRACHLNRIFRRLDHHDLIVG